MVNVVAAHAGHLWGSWMAASGVTALSVVLVVLVEIVMDRRPPQEPPAALAGRGGATVEGDGSHGP